MGNKNISDLETFEIMRLINKEDHAVSSSIENELDNISTAVDEATKRFVSGGRLIYIGAGTSGRLGYLDAIELEPTYGVSPSRAFGILAGGNKAMFQAVEGAEDSEDQAIKDLKSISLSTEDVLIAITASGNTPYTVSAAKYANEVGALTIGIACTKINKLSETVRVPINVDVGPEVILGSTRMKAGSAQKMVLNMLSTGIMINSGRVYKNYMIYVQPTNKKLENRATNIISDILGISETDARELLIDANNSIPAALVMKNKGMNYSEALDFLKNKTGKLNLD